MPLRPLLVGALLLLAGPVQAEPAQPTSDIRTIEEHFASALIEHIGGSISGIVIAKAGYTAFKFSNTATEADVKKFVQAHTTNPALRKYLPSELLTKIRGGPFKIGTVVVMLTGIAVMAYEIQSSDGKTTTVTKQDMHKAIVDERRVIEERLLLLHLRQGCPPGPDLSMCREVQRWAQQHSVDEMKATGLDCPEARPTPAELAAAEAASGKGAEEKRVPQRVKDYEDDPLRFMMCAVSADVARDIKVGEDEVSYEPVK
jgi:hypothetical protein